MRLRGFVALAFVVLVFNGCSGGGGGGSQPQPAPQTSVSGTAAANASLTGYHVNLLALVTPSGTTVPGIIGQGTVGSDGRYSAGSGLSVSGPLPIVAWASSIDDQAHYPRVWSIAHHSGGTANATPLTSLIVARLLNRRPGRFGDDRAVFQLQSKTEADVSAAQQQVVAYLLSRTTPVNAGSVGNFVSTPLTLSAGDAYFDALTRLHNSLLDSETITGVEEHMLFGSDGPADLRAMLSLDFMANCKPTVVNSGVVPSGSTHIIADGRAITFGSVVDLLFHTNDQVTVTAGMTSDNHEQ